MSDSTPVSPPLEVGGYRLDHVLAKGGMAEVWLAHKQGLGGFSKQVVLKRVLPHLAGDPAFMELFLKEARIAALFSHVNVVQIIELGESEGSYFIAMEYVSGCTLRMLQRACFQRRVGLPLPVLCRILVDACAGLHYAHDLKNLKGRALDLVHLDVSPENLLISSEGVTKVADFGVARAREHTHSTVRTKVLGKAVYMAPEQAAGGRLDRRTDIYALGAIAFEFLSGQLPIQIDSEQTQQRQMLEAVVDFSGVREICPAAVPVLERALAFAREARQPSAMALSNELIEALGPPAPYSEVGRTLTGLLHSTEVATLPRNAPALVPTAHLPPLVPQQPPQPGLNFRSTISDRPPSAEPERRYVPSPITELDQAPLTPGLKRPVPQPSQTWRTSVLPARRGGARRWYLVGAAVAGVLAWLAISGVFENLRRPARVQVHFLNAAGLSLILDGKAFEAEQPQWLLPGRHRLEVVDPTTHQSSGRWVELNADAEQQVPVGPP